MRRSKASQKGRSIARCEGINKKPDPGNWSISATLHNGNRVYQSVENGVKKDAEAYLAKLKLDEYREPHFGIKPQPSWRKAVVQYLELKLPLKSFSNAHRISRFLEPYLRLMMLNLIKWWRGLIRHSGGGQGEQQTCNGLLQPIRHATPI